MLSVKTWLVPARLALAMAILVPFSVSASAQTCRYSVSDINFGNIDVTAPVPADAVGTFTASCSGTPGTTVRVCPNFEAGSGGAGPGGVGRLLTFGRNTLLYELYSDAARTQIWGSVLGGSFALPPNILVPLSAAGNGNATRTIYARIPAGQSRAPVGLYASSFAGNDVRITNGYDTDGDCAAFGARRARQERFAVSGSVTSMCRVSATGISFGIIGTLDRAIDATGSVTVTCNSGVAYKVSLSRGLSNDVTDPVARVMNGPNGRIIYGLYSDAAMSVPWGWNLGTEPGGASVGAPRNHPVYARIQPQLRPPSGSYSDTIVVTVDY
jgi:spore coat protein U-like protein